MAKEEQSVDQAALNEEASQELEAMISEVEADATVTDAAPEPEEAYQIGSLEERMAIIETLIFVSGEPLTVKTIADVLKEDRNVVEEAIAVLAEEFNGRNGGLHLRELAGGWQIATRPQY